MAYSTDILNLGATHHWKFDGNSTDTIGSVTATDTSVIYTSSAIAEDATNCLETNAVGDRVSIATTTDINNSAQTRKCVTGWFMTTAIQPPPKRIYGEGDATTCFQFVMAYGNNVMFECVEPTNFTLQVFGDTPLVPNRAYHLCGIFEGNGFGNEIRFYLDGVEQLSALPTNRQPGTADLNLRGVAEFGDPAGTVGVGGATVLLNAPINGKWNHWASFDGANAVLTDTEVREELFEKGALPDVTIATGIQSVMQTSLNAYSSTERGNAPLCIRVNDVTGSGNLALDASSITFDPLASIHVQWMGTGTLTWTNTGTSNASIVSTPNGGTVVIVKPVTAKVTVKSATTGSVVQGARVFIEADSGGPLALGTDILNTTTDVLGVASTTFNYTTDQPIVGKVRKGTSATYYKTSSFSNTITEDGVDIVVLVVPD